jgi:hypothetical protein
MKQPLISLLYATARPQKIEEVLPRWICSTPIEIVVCTDSRTNFFDFTIGHLTVKFIINTGPKNCVAAYNKAAKESTGDILIQIADDLFPCVNWDTKIVASLDINKAQALYISDDFCKRGVYVQHAIITRKLYERFGYLLYPKYESMYSDWDFNEMVIKYADNFIDKYDEITFEHRHEGRFYDKVSEIHESPTRLNRGLKLFKERKKQGFPKETF